jgi:hypothetical protein
MAVLSSMPSPGPTLPANCTNVKVQTVGVDVVSSGNRMDVTVLEDTERQYQDAPLVDVDPLADGSGVAQIVVAQFFGEAPEPDPAGSTGWVCTEVETEYAVGEFVKGTATYKYVPPEAS